MTLYLGTEKVTPTITTGGGSANIESLNITPTTNQQVINATSSVDGYAPVTVSAVTSSIDENITAENIKKDVTILGVIGSYEGSGGSANIESLNITPTTNAQTITATGGVDGYSPINVSAVTSSIDENITAENIKKDVVILGVTGSYEGSSEDKKKFDLGIDSFIGDVSNGTLQAPTLEETDLVFDNVTDLAPNALKNAFYNKDITSVVFPDLVNISSNGNSSLLRAFAYDSSLISVSFPLLENVSASYVFQEAFEYDGKSSDTLIISFPKLTSVTGEYAFSNTFNGKDSVKSISFPELTSVTGNSAFKSTFSYCRYLTSVSLPKLTTIGTKSMVRTFGSCTSLTRVDFPSLTSVQIDSFKESPDNWEAIFYECYNLTEIHFRADMANVITNMYGYSDKWGASNATIYFDLASATIDFEVTPSQDTSIYVNGTLVVNDTIDVSSESTHSYTIINSNYPIYYGLVTTGAEGTTTTVIKDITSYSGHNITINTNVSDCTVTFNYNGLSKAATTVTSTSYESDDIYSESSISVGYTITKEGYFPKSGTVTFNNSDVSINVELRSNDIDLSDYEFDIDENNDVVLTKYIGSDVETLVIPNVDE